MLIGVFSDAHGNFGGYNSAREALFDAGVTSMVFLGDAVGYIPSTEVVRHLMLTPSIAALAGNHELMMLSDKQPDPVRAAAYQFERTLKKLTGSEIRWLSRLPRSLHWELNGRRLLFVHGSPLEPSFGYVYPDTNLSVFAGVEADVVFMGNTHRPFIRAEGKTLFVNVGSCGLPRDGDARGCAAVYDTDSGIARILRFSIAKGSLQALAHCELDPVITQRLKSQALYKEKY